MWVKPPNGARERDAAGKMIEEVFLIVKEEILHSLFRPTMWWNYSVRRWAGIGATMIFDLSGSCVRAPPQPTLLSIPGSFHSPMPTPAWSSLLLAHADHVVPLLVRPLSSAAGARDSPSPAFHLWLTGREDWLLGAAGSCPVCSTIRSDGPFFLVIIASTDRDPASTYPINKRISTKMATKQGH